MHKIIKFIKSTTYVLTDFPCLYSTGEERGRAMVEKSQKNQIRHTDLGAPLEVVYKRQTHLVTRSNRTKMSRLIIVVLAVVVLLQVVCAIDLSTTKNVEISFADEDVVPKTALVRQNYLSNILACI